MCACVALIYPSVRGHAGTMLVVFMPRGSQMGSTNSCFHEARAEPAWLMWQCKCNAVTHADICSCKHVMSIHKLLHTHAHGRGRTFWRLTRGGALPESRDLSSTCTPTCVRKGSIIWLFFRRNVPASVSVSLSGHSSCTTEKQLTFEANEE